MKNQKIEVTELESKVLQILADEMDDSPTYSNVFFPDMVKMSKIKAKPLSGVCASLIKKGLLSIDDMETGKRLGPDTSMHILYLEGDAKGLVEDWTEEIGFRTDMTVKGSATAAAPAVPAMKSREETEIYIDMLTKQIKIWETYKKKGIQRAEVCDAQINNFFSIRSGLFWVLDQTA